MVIKIWKSILMAGSLLLVLAGCQKEEEHNSCDETYYIPDSIKAKVPYTGKDTLVYLYTTRTDTETVIFAPDYMNTYFHEEIDICGTKRYENIYMEYESIKVDSIENSKRHVMIIELIKNDGDFSDLLVIKPNRFDIATNYNKIKSNIDSLMIGTNIFYNVFKNKHSKGVIYWSNRFGLLRFSPQNKSINWYLISKK